MTVSAGLAATSAENTSPPVAKLTVTVPSKQSEAAQKAAETTKKREEFKKKKEDYIKKLRSTKEPTKQ